ncbi:MAG: cytochrome c [Nitrospirota bacterium]
MKKLVAIIGGAALLALVVISAGAKLFEDPHVAEGRALFQYYCAHCHGAKGRGDGYNADFMDPRPRDLTDRVEPYMGEQSNDDIYTTLSRDVKEEEEVTDPEEMWIPAAMPTFKYTLSDKERWSLVAFVRSLHDHEDEPIDFTREMSAERPHIEVGAPPTLASLKADEVGTLAERGKHLYESKFMCFSCHKISSEGGTVGPELDRAGVRLNDKWIFRWTKVPQAIRHDTKMPSFGMSDEEALAITAYLKTLREPPPPTPSS